MYSCKPHRKGVSVEQLVSEFKSKAKPQKIPEAQAFLGKAQKNDAADVAAKDQWAGVRKDNSPVKVCSVLS
jgi:hypothetical protein